jgi:predicted dehydrogenase
MLYSDCFAIQRKLGDLGSNNKNPKLKIENRKLNIGIIGAGEFAEFATLAFLKVEGIHVIGVTDINPASSHKMADKFNMAVYLNEEDLLSDSRIDLVYIATPPYLHFDQSSKALHAGKHVICEKPAALLTSEAESLAALARSKNLLYTVNLMQRYNPLYDFVKRIIDEKWLGDFVHGFFENYASDEKLIPEHWFWDENQSGGIFIEHGVHFFDMFRGWLGEGKLISSFQIQRPDVTGKVIDRVQADVLYKNGPVTFYHGFNQPKVLDRQELRLQFDRGDITLYEWVPVKIRLHGLLKTEQIDMLKSIFPGSSVVIHPDTKFVNQKVKGKFTDIYFDHLITLEYGHISEKMVRYEQLVTSMIIDQWTWILDPSHRRRIDDTNAVESVRMAEAAKERSMKF